MARLRKGVTIHGRLNHVYEFTRAPQNWHRFIVGLSEPAQVEGDGGKGTKTEHRYAIAGISIPMHIEVLEDVKTAKDSRRTLAVHGPLEGKMLWTSEAVGDTTVVSVLIDYALPVKLLGHPVDKELLERIQERAIETSLENMRIFCEAQPAH